MGQTIKVQEKTYKDLESFVCCMYGKPSYSSVNKLRYDIFMQKFRPKSGKVLSASDGVDLSLLPPCQDSLYMHIQRANYQAYIWNNSIVHYPKIESPLDHGWELDENDKLDYKWTNGEILPVELIDIINEIDEKENMDNTDGHEDNESDLEIEYIADEELEGSDLDD